MMLNGTLIVLGLWLTFVWFVDPDRFRQQRLTARVRSRTRSRSRYY
jgi:hypothetical protein